MRSGSYLPPPMARPASDMASWAAATPIWHSRHITFRPLRMAFFCSFSSGPKFSMSPVNSRASAATCVGRYFEGTASRRPTPLRPDDERIPERLLGAAQGADQAQTSDDDAALGGRHDRKRVVGGLGGREIARQRSAKTNMANISPPIYWGNAPFSSKPADGGGYRLVVG